MEQKFVCEEIAKKDGLFKNDINKKLMELMKRSRRYSMIPDEERKKAQTEGDEKREERQRLNKEIRDLQAAKEAQLDSSGQATKAFGSKIYELQDKLKP